MYTDSFIARFAPVEAPSVVDAQAPRPAAARADSTSVKVLPSDSLAAPSNVPHRRYLELFQGRNILPTVRDKLFELFYRRHELAEHVAQKCGISNETINVLRSEARKLREMPPERVAQLRTRLASVGSAGAAHRKGETLLSHLRWLEQRKELDLASSIAEPATTYTTGVTYTKGGHLLPEVRERMIGLLMKGDREGETMISNSGICRRAQFELRGVAKERLSLTPREIESIRVQLAGAEVGDVAKLRKLRSSTVRWIESGAAELHLSWKQLQEAKIDALIDELRSVAQTQTHPNPAAVRSDVHPPYPNPSVDRRRNASEFMMEHEDAPRFASLPSDKAVVSLRSVLQAYLDGSPNVDASSLPGLATAPLQLARLPSDEIDESFRSMLLAFLDGSSNVDASSPESPSMTLSGTKRSAEASNLTSDRDEPKRLSR